MIDRIPGGAPLSPPEPNGSSGGTFSKILKAPAKPMAPGAAGTAGTGAPGTSPSVAPTSPKPNAGAPSVQSLPLKTRGVEAPSPAVRSPTAQMVGQLAESQRKLDRILKLAESGRTFSPAELLAFQAHAYRASQEVDMASKVVDKASAAVKQTLQTQV